MIWTAAAVMLAALPAAGTEGDGMIPLDSLSIRIIYDNVEPRDGFEAQWGFSCVVTGCGRTILFDTGGRGDVLMRNLSAAGISPSDIDIVIISHEHWDHTGGLGAFLAENREVTVYIPSSFSSDIKKRTAEGCSGLSEVSDPVEIIPGVYSTGDMTGPVREQSLAVRTDGGTVVITGCAHPGVDWIVERAGEVTGGPVLCVMGGFHLGGAGEARLGEIAEAFDKSGIKYCGASHCTGDESMAYFAARYGERYIRLGAGGQVRGSDLKSP